MIDAIAIIISLISLVCSIVLATIQIQASAKNNRTNLEAEFFKELYAKILMYDIPKGREYIFYNNKRITGVDQLIDAISKIRRNSLYFKSNHKEYYEELVKKCQGLEDKLVKTDKEFTSQEFFEFMNDIEIRIESIYAHVSKEYIGE